MFSIWSCVFILFINVPFIITSEQKNNDVQQVIKLNIDNATKIIIDHNFFDEIKKLVFRKLAGDNKKTRRVATENLQQDGGTNSGEEKGFMLYGFTTTNKRKEPHIVIENPVEAYSYLKWLNADNLKRLILTEIPPTSTLLPDYEDKLERDTTVKNNDEMIKNNDEVASTARK